MEERLRESLEEKMAHNFSKTVQAVIENGMDDEIFEVVHKSAGKWLKENKDVVDRIVSENMEGAISDAVERIADNIDIDVSF
jgi:hypothetical protein